jgi:hypothetical protein
VKRLAGILIVMACATAPASAQALGPLDAVYSSQETCRESPDYTYRSCHQETTVLGYTAGERTCTWRYEQYRHYYDCSETTQAGFGSVRVTCEGETHSVTDTKYSLSYEDSDRCSARAAGTEVGLVECDTPRTNELDEQLGLYAGLPAVPSCQPAP